MFTFKRSRLQEGRPQGARGQEAQEDKVPNLAAQERATALDPASSGRLLQRAAPGAASGSTGGAASKPKPQGVALPLGRSLLGRGMLGGKTPATGAPMQGRKQAPPSTAGASGGPALSSGSSGREEVGGEEVSEESEDLGDWDSQTDSDAEAGNQAAAVPAAAALPGGRGLQQQAPGGRAGTTQPQRFGRHQAIWNSSESEEEGGSNPREGTAAAAARGRAQQPAQRGPSGGRTAGERTGDQQGQRSSGGRGAQSLAGGAGGGGAVSFTSDSTSSGGSGDWEASDEADSESSGDEYEPTPEMMKNGKGAAKARAAKAGAAGASRAAVAKPTAAQRGNASADTTGAGDMSRAAKAAAVPRASKAGGSAPAPRAALAALDRNAAKGAAQTGSKRKAAGVEEVGGGPAVGDQQAQQQEEEEEARQETEGKPKAAAAKRTKAQPNSVPVIIKPAMLAQRREPLVLCEMPEHLTLEGDSGAIGRIVVQEGSGGAGGSWRLDLKGVVYEAELAALPSTVLVASLPKGGEKMEVYAAFDVVLRADAGQDYAAETAAALIALEDYDSDGYGAPQEAAGGDGKKGRGKAGGPEQAKAKAKPKARRAGGARGGATGRGGAKPRGKGTKSKRAAKK